MRTKIFKLTVKMKFIFWLLIIMPIISTAQEKLIWDFPVKPGTEEWKELKNYQDRLNVYNIPDSLLKKIATEDLVKTCLNYPEFRLIMTRNSLQMGYDYLKSIFNGFGELEKRSNTGALLLDEYQKFDPSNIKNYDTHLEKGGFSSKMRYIEILLAQKPILSKLDVKTKEKLIENCIFNYEKIEELTEYYTTFNLLTPTLILGRILEVDNLPEYVAQKTVDKNLQKFVDYSMLYDYSSLSDIIDISKEYIIQIKTNE